MGSCRASGCVFFGRVAVTLLTLCLAIENASAISFEEFIGYPFNEVTGYSVFPRGIDLKQGVPIPIPFPYFGRVFSYVNVSVSYSYC